MSALDDTIRHQLPHALQRTDIVGLGEPRRGRCRDVYELDGHVLLVATDRLTSGRQFLGTVPFKGEVLTRSAGWWFDRVRSKTPITAQEMIDPQALLSLRAQVLPVRVGAWRNLTGALAQSYQDGRRDYGATNLPDGLSEGEDLPKPIFAPLQWRDPSGDAAGSGSSGHVLLTADELKEAMPDEALSSRAFDMATQLFDIGAREAQKRGFRMVDTSYKLGTLPGGDLAPVSTLHTPDSTRYWLIDQDGERDRFHEDSMVARWRRENSWDGHGEPPLADDLCLNLAAAYLEFAQRMLGEFEPHPGPVVNRLNYALSIAGLVA